MLFSTRGGVARRQPRAPACRGSTRGDRSRAQPQASMNTVRCSSTPAAAWSESSAERSCGPMLLAIDVGNTNIVLGVFDGTTLVQSWRLQTLRERTSDELGLIVDGLFAHSRIERVQIRGVILGSVVPPLTGTMRAMA